MKNETIKDVQTVYCSKYHELHWWSCVLSEGYGKYGDELHNFNDVTFLNSPKVRYERYGNNKKNNLIATFPTKVSCEISRLKIGNSVSKDLTCE